MVNRFDKKDGFDNMAAIQRKRSKSTPEKIDEIIDWRPILFDPGGVCPSNMPEPKISTSGRCRKRVRVIG